MIAAILPFASKLLDKVWPDPATKAEAEAKLLELAQTGELAKMANDTELTKAFLADTQSAREREAAIATSDSAPFINKVIVPYLAIGILASTFALFAMLMFAEVKPDSKDILIYILGVLSALSTQVVAYFFGSSDGSKSKDAQIQAMVKK